MSTNDLIEANGLRLWCSPMGRMVRVLAVATSHDAANRAMAQRSDLSVIAAEGGLVFLARRDDNGISIPDDEAAQVVDAMRPHYAVGTINRSLGTLKRALTLAWERGATRENWGAHVKRLPEHNQRTVYLEPDQVQAIAQHASENVRAAIWIALMTGARRGEVCKIRPEDIGRDAILIRAGNTKALKTRSVPIVPALRPWLKYLPLAINYEGLKTGFRRAREAAGMPHVHFHDLRHSCASTLLQLGVDLYTVSKILGHSSIRTTERYSHLKIKAQRDALNKLSRAVTQRKAK